MYITQQLHGAKVTYITTSKNEGDYFSTHNPMAMKNLTFAFAFLWSSFAFAQSTFPFDIVLEPVSVTNLPGMQSYAAAQHNGKWLIIGGRIDGLHQRQPWQAFNAAGHNTNVYVIDPIAKTFHTAPLSGLSNDTLVAQLSSTNPNFAQVGNYLYFLGGYGLDASAVHITHPMLTVIDVPSTIDDVVQSGTLDSTAFVSFNDEDFAVTGGKLMHLDGSFYLVGGHRFDGQYNPMGHNTFTQAYSEQVLPFTVSGTFPNLNYSKGTAIVDSNELHRRDYNVTYMTDGTETYFNAWSGVFQKNQTANLPYLNAVEVRDTGIYPVPGFSQYLNHYHCPSVSLYGENQGAMYTVFFGGIAQYYYDNGTLTQDNDIPFVKTIGVVEKRNGLYSESYSSTEMPGLLGAGAEFFPSDGFASTGEIFLADSLANDTAWVGHIFGGINSPGRNIFFGGMTNNSTASPTLFKVGFVRTSGLRVFESNYGENLGLLVSPNPSRGKLIVQIQSVLQGMTNFEVFDTNGKLILHTEIPTKAGSNTIDLGALQIASGKYVLTATQAGARQSINFIWN